MCRMQSKLETVNGTTDSVRSLRMNRVNGEALRFKGGGGKGNFGIAGANRVQNPRIYVEFGTF